MRSNGGLRAAPRSRAVPLHRAAAMSLVTCGVLLGSACTQKRAAAPPQPQLQPRELSPAVVLDYRSPAYDTLRVGFQEGRFAYVTERRS